MKRRISIFGATGSIGQSTLDLIRRDADAYEVIALTGGRNVAQLARDAREFGASIAVTAYDDALAELRDALADSGVEAAAGVAAIHEAAEQKVDWAMSAIIGAAGLVPGLKILQQGATLALANKETMVTAGPLVLETARRHNATLLPVDSEHSAVFQALVGEDISTVERVVITASGGAFRDWPLEDIANATVEQASAHPNWDMGQRITIDSASMFNKALELIETREFFDIAPEQIEVLVHPESIVHALVGFNDGALMAHVGPPDMRHAIGYALHWPERKTLPVARLDLSQIGKLTFRSPDLQRYPALRLARDVMEMRGLAGTVFNAAKEVALDGFIARRIGFLEMAELVEKALVTISAQSGHIDAELTLDNILQLDQMSRETMMNLIDKR